MYTCSMWIPKYELTIPFPSHSSQFPFPSTFQICRSYNTERPAVPRRQRHAVVDSSDLIKGKASPYSITERRVPSWSRFLAVSLQVTWVINPAVGCHYFPRGPQLPSQPLRGLLPVFHAHGNLMGRHLRKPMHSRTSLLGEWCRYSARRRSANQLITAKSCGDRIIDAMMRFVRCLRRLNENRTRIVRPPPFIHYSRHSLHTRAPPSTYHDECTNRHTRRSDETLLQLLPKPRADSNWTSSAELLFLPLTGVAR